MDDLDFAIHRRQFNSKTLYTSTIVFLSLTLSSLPFIHLDVSLRASSVVRPAIEVCPIRSAVTGKISSGLALENKSVAKGDLLFIIDTGQLSEKTNYMLEKVADNNRLASDVRTAISSSIDPSLAYPAFLTSLYQFQSAARSDTT